ncbi:hypothetical protein [Chryseolinea serpens]|uniref:hypothetical protein n=1 Tax=Chryseolinea serpens TaxID=947013 RepID=UPI0011613573|nr:hypothetical protein [Chryseolinea serpens]
MQFDHTYDDIRKYLNFELDRSSALQAAITKSDFNAIIAEIGSDLPKGIGETTVYDTSLRIAMGLRRRIRPKRIYLHAGTRIGAKNLGLPTSRKVALSRGDIKTLYPEIIRLLKEPSEIENFLCIYKDSFLKRKFVSHMGSRLQNSTVGGF